MPYIHPTFNNRLINQNGQNIKSNKFLTLNLPKSRCFTEKRPIFNNRLINNKNYMKQCLLVFLVYCFQFSGNCAVILQYHHVSDTTPTSTSISPKQFAAHLQYLSDNNFTVVPLSVFVDAIKDQKKLKDKHVAITFDDAYTDILTYAKPLLNQFNYPYTIFINPSTVELNYTSYLTWSQLKSLSDEGVIIANHGFDHTSLARIPTSTSERDWFKEETDKLLHSEALIKNKTGKSWQYFAYPFGEYTPLIQQWIKENNFVAFTQQSGAVGLATDLTNIPRFPVSQPYDDLVSLSDKLNSLAFNIELHGKNAETIFEYQQTKSVTFNITIDDFEKSQLNCYISGLGRQEISWQDKYSFTVNFSADLPVGRVRCNCTAPSISNPGRFYWYSKPWFILKAGGQWYPL